MLDLVAALALSAAPAQGWQRNPPARADFVTCTPGSIQVLGGPPQPSRYPIADALSLAGPGTLITLKPGEYKGFTIGFSSARPWNARTSGGTAAAPVTVVGEGRVRIVPERDGGDTISINQDVQNGHFLFRNLTIEPGYRAGIMFFQVKQGRMHEGYRFEDCDILGTWNHVANRGGRSKWAVWGQGLKDFVFRGVTRQARIENIQKEHAFYLQNPRGSITIERVHASRLGRTFCQFTARAKDGPEGVGDIVVRDCVVEDVGIAFEDGYKGGSAFTVAGRIRGNVTFERNTYRAGFSRDLLRLTRNDAPYGTGALVVWDGGEKVPNASVTLRDNDFEFARGCGDRPVVSIGGCEQVAIVGRNRFVSGGVEAALSLDPAGGRNPGGQPKSIPNGRVLVADETLIEGAVHVRGRDASSEELRAIGLSSTLGDR